MDYSIFIPINFPYFIFDLFYILGELFADTEKPIFTGEITGNIFILGNFYDMHGGPEKTYSDSEAGE